MGGELMLRILTDGREVCLGVKELILQPQSEIAEVRRYLRTHAYRIAAEDMVFEDGKYYPMMRVVPETAGQAGADTQADEKPAEDGKRSRSGACADVPADAACAEELYDLYGEHLLNTHHPVLQQYLVYQEKLLLTILEELKRQPESDKITARMDEIGHKLKYNRMAQNQTT
jgi:tRNA (adenine22-N1)-methyltransferase